MSQNTLIEKIKNDAAAAVATIKADGATKVEEIQRAIEAEIATMQKESAAELDKQKAHLELVALSKAKQAGNIAVQSAKRAQIDAIIDAARSQLVNLSATAYVDCFTAHVKAIVPTTVDIRAVRAPQNRLDETATILVAAGFTGEVVADARIAAGLVIEAADGVYDITIDRLLNDRRADLEVRIVHAAGV
jgi:vacuolar-type H+-ATPase subunit E/Vma4